MEQGDDPYMQTGFTENDTDFDTTIHTPEIEMFRPVEVIEGPTNGLDDFIDWNQIEQGLAAGDFASKQDFRAELQRQFDEAGVEFTRGFFRAAIKGLFPEYLQLYRALRSNPTAAARITA